MTTLSNQTRCFVLLGSLLLTLAACHDAPPTDQRNPLTQDVTVSRSQDLIAGALRGSGTVQLEVSCRPELATEFTTAVALLHSFFYDEARSRFEDLARRDPDCAMAWWGVAMTWYHPLWAPPTIEERAKGLAAVQRAEAIGARSRLEEGLIQAIGAFYKTNELPGESRGVAGCNCCGPQAHGARARAFNATFKELHQRFPDNTEVAVFYALSMLGTVNPKDKTFARQHAAARILEPLFERNPEHPGIAHYIIHAYDYPELADKALVAARKYDDIAPWVPHALHMPTHIYTRLGMWPDSIKGNVASSKAARDYAARRYAGHSTMDDLHAMDYLVFAYLQTGQDEAARRVLGELDLVKGVVPGNGFASAYALAAIPARYTLEREDWAAASQLSIPVEAFTKDYPMAVGHIEFARAVGAARLGKVALAQAAVARLVKIRESLRGSRFDYWTDQVEIQRLAAAAWLAQAEGKTVEAKQLLGRASKLEDAAGTHPVTPGQILPAREQLADLLLEVQEPAAALAEYERSLLAFPRRFRSHAGALTAARAAGDKAAALRHAKSLIEMAGESTQRPEILGLARELMTSER